MATKAYKYRDPIVFNPREEHKGTVILLHGLGDTGDGWASIAAEFAPSMRHVKFIFPHAPLRPITLNFGMTMPGWFDIASLDDINQKEDKEGLHESRRYVEELVQAEVDGGLPSDKVVVAGFSQGGAIALQLLRSDKKLAGIVGLSTWLSLRREAPIISEANKETPIILCHGTSDPVVQFEFGQGTYNTLKELDAKVEFKAFPGMGHQANPEELQDVENFLKKVLPK